MDTQIDTSQPTDIGSLVNQPGDKGTIADLVKLDRAKAAEDTKITINADRRMEQDQARLDAAYKAEGVAASEQLKPWNAEAEHKKYETNPIEGFGSFGGLFAMVASAFTKAPMQNAIEGMAGAINGIKEGNEAAYNRAYQSWKDNTKLALERFKTQHELYQDAMSLFDHDATAANAKLHNAAVRFGDKQMLTLAEHGMVKEMFELQASRASAASQMMELQDKITLRTVQKAAIDAEVKSLPQTGDPNKDKLNRAIVTMKILGGKIGTAEQEAVGNAVLTTPPDKLVDKLIDIHQQFSARSTNIQSYQDARTQMEQQKGSPLTPDEDAELLHKFGLTPRGAGTGGGTGTSSQAIKAKAIEEIKQKHKAEGKEISTAEAEHEYNVTRAAPTGNKIDELQGKVDTAELAIEHSQKNIDFLKTYKGGAGLMSKIMRGEEIAENIAGVSTQSDRVAFRRRVHELQEIIPRVLVDANGRPLKAEQDKANDVIAGLQNGDTSPNTIRAYEDLVKDLQYRIQKYKERQGKASPTSSDPVVPGSTGWLDAYPEKH